MDGQAPSFDLVQEFLSRKVAMAVWRNVEVDPDDVLLGLTEFSRFKVVCMTYYATFQLSVRECVCLPYLFVSAYTYCFFTRL